MSRSHHVNNAIGKKIDVRIFPDTAVGAEDADAQHNPIDERKDLRSTGRIFGQELPEFADSLVGQRAARAYVLANDKSK